MAKFGMLCIQAERDLDVIGVLTTNMAYIHMARNVLVQGARKVKPTPTHLMFVDQDSIPNPDTITRLLSFDKPVIAATYYKKVSPYLPIVYHIRPEFKHYDYDFPDHGEQPFLLVDGGVGMGATLIRMDVFDKVEEKFGDNLWFQCPALKSSAGSDVVGSMMGEDVFFCDRCNQTGIEIWCDPRDQVGHIGQLDVCGELFRITRQMRQENLT